MLTRHCMSKSSPDQIIHVASEYYGCLIPLPFRHHKTSLGSGDSPLTWEKNIFINIHKLINNNKDSLQLNRYTCASSTNDWSELRCLAVICWMMMSYQQQAWLQGHRRCLQTEMWSSVWVSSPPHSFS